MTTPTLPMATPEVKPDCQMLGTVQDLFPPVLVAVKKFVDTKSDAESRSVARGLNTEAALYRRLIAKILLLVDVSSIRDPRLHPKVTAKLGEQRTDLLVAQLNEMHRLLTTLTKDFGNTSRGTAILRQLQPDSSSVKANAPKSKMQRRVDKVSRANVQLSALLELRTSLPFPDRHHSPPSTTSWYHHDGEKPAEALKAIVAAFACSCDKSHIAGLRCACSQCNPGFAEPEPKTDDWDFEVALCQPDSQPAGDGDVEGKTADKESPTVPSSGTKSTTWTSRISLEANPRLSQGPGLCSFLSGGTNGEQAGVSIPHLTSLKESSRTFSSLYDLIRGRTPLLDTRKRMALAYRLSSAVLQYNGTPWADRFWRSEDWLVGLDRSGKDGLPVVFLNRQLSSCQEPTKPTKTGGAWGVASREPILAQLGIALAELALGRSLSEVRSEDPGLIDKEVANMTDTNLLDLLTARKILSLGYIALATSPAFENVVSACVTQQYRDGYDAGVKELDPGEPTFLERATIAILQPLYQEIQAYLGYSNSSTNASSRAETKRNLASPVHKHAEARNWKPPAPAPRKRAKPAASDTLRPSRRFSPPPPAASSGSEGVFVESVNNTAKTDTTRTDAAVGTKTSGTDRDGRRGTPRPTEPTSSLQRSQQSSGFDTPASESADDDAGSMDIQNGEAGAVEPPNMPSFAPSCGEDNSTWSFEDYSESEQSLDSSFQWLPSEHFVHRLHDGHPLLAQSDMALKTIIRAFRISMAAGGAGGNTMPSRQPPSNYGSYAGSNAGGRKRARGNNGKAPLRRTSDDGEDDDQYQQSPPASRAGPPAEAEGPDLACPFFKKDSIAHQPCYKFQLKRIRDVKQHVGRKHSMPIYCPICNSTFAKEQERDDHVRDRMCPESPFTKPEGTTEEQKRRLGRRAPANQTREEQWYGIFYTLFDASVPKPTSPYLEIDGVLFHGAFSLQKFIEGPGVQVLDTFLSENNAVSWNIPYEGRPYTDEDAAAFRHHILERALREMFKGWEESAARGATTAIPESRPPTSEPTQSSSDNYPVTPSPSSMASQAGTTYTTPQPVLQLPLRPGFASSSMPQPIGNLHLPSTNPDFMSAGQDFGNFFTESSLSLTDEFQQIFGMAHLNMQNGLMTDVDIDTASLNTSTSASEAGQNMNYGPWNFQ